MPKPPETREGLYTRIALIAVLLTGAAAVIGVPVIWLGVVLFLCAWAVGAYEIVIQAKKRQWKKLHCLFQLGAAAFIGLCLYSAWNIFVVKMNLRFITGGPVMYGNRNVEGLRFAVQLTNRGKPTSLTAWRSHLVMADGRKLTGEILYLSHQDSVETEDVSHNKTFYAIPACDLTLETTRAMQTADSVFGIIAFAFPDLQAETVPPDTKLILQATDMLGRNIESEEIKFEDLNKNPRDVFPCPVKQ